MSGEKESRNPISTTMRSHSCGELRPEHEGEEVRLAGWVSSNRDHGGLIFIDLRDRYGTVQVVLDPATGPEGLDAARAARLEDVIAVTGKVRPRPEKQVNPDLATGGCEVLAETVTLLAKTETPPFVIEDERTATEELSLKYRYLDLRRVPMQRNLELRHRIALATRQYFDSRRFLDIETPLLIRSTPEGARDFLVPSRLHHGRFYALPQSPQQYKQLLMMAGLDRYAQIVKCFRDEDFRADRQPEFTQLDVEMSFATEEDVVEVTEGYLVHLMKEVLGVDTERPFPRFTYEEAMERYGSDKPDLRFDMEIGDLSDGLSATGFKVFRGVLDQGGTVRGFVARGAGNPGRREVDELTGIATGMGAKGLVPLTVAGGSLEGTIARFLTPDEQASIIQKLGGEEGDLVLIVADDWLTTLQALGALRVEMAGRLGLRRSGTYRFTWVRAFPLLEWDEEAGRLVAVHHPFTSAANREEFVAVAKELPEGTLSSEAPPAWRERVLALKAAAYDVALNGVEIGGGSIRNHRSEDQAAMFRLLGLSPEEAEEKFGFFVEALRYGAPPHGGIAFGFDRIAMLLAGEDSIRQVIAFPKTTSALSLMDGSPGPVDEAQLAELGLRLRENGPEETEPESGV